MEPDGDSPPIWSPPTTPFIPVRRRHRSTSPILNPVAVIIAIPILILLVIFFVFLPFLSHTNQILKQPSSVKKGWDSLNIVLVFFAIFFGVFARRNDENSSSDDADDQRHVDTISNISDLVNRGRDSVLSSNWLDFPDQKEYNKMSMGINSGGSRLRSSSSYPDLRQESLWESDGNRFKFLDDSEVNFHRTTGNVYSHGRRSYEVEKEAAETVAREIPVDKYVLTPIQPPPTPPNSQTPMPPPPPPPPPVKRRRSVHSVPHTEKVERERNEAEFYENGSAAPPPAPPPPPLPPYPPPPPPPAPEFYPLTERREKIQRKKSGTTKEIATAIASLYQGSHGRRRKKVKSRDIYESATQNSSPPSVIVPPSTPPPPPPPPPPPSKVLQNLFKKSSKSKRVHSVPNTTSSPPPPPPPPNSIFSNLFKTASKSKRFQLSSASSPPPPPPPPPPPSSILKSSLKHETKSRRFKNLDTTPPPPPPPETSRRHRTVNNGLPPKPSRPSTSYPENTIYAPPSPLIPMPPPPPFRMPKMKFVAKGDFVRISSANSSPEVEDVDVPSVKSEGGDSTGASISCPSPDVNTKADTFISRLRGEWRLEKMNSMKEKRQLGSLSTGPGPSQFSP